MSLFDSHTHLYEAQFDGDREAVIERAREAGVAGLLVLGEDVATSQRAVELAERHAGVFAAAGCHPHHAASMDGPSLAQLDALARQDRVVAIGEIGLDFYRDLSPRDKQSEVFRWHLDLARELRKPVAVHCRDAQEAMLPIIEEWAIGATGHRAVPRFQGSRVLLGVMHYFSGDAALAQRYIDLGFLISIHTSITYPKSERLREVARALPLESLVVETDCPYGAPQSIRGQRNEPAHVVEAVKAIAALRGEAVEHVAEATLENACRLFGVEPAMLWRAGKASVGSS